MNKKTLFSIIAFFLSACSNESSIENIDLQLKQARLDLNKQNYQIARNRYLSILKEDLDNLDAYLGLAKISEARGEHDKSLHYLSKIIATQPSNLQAHLLSGDIFLAKKDLEKAVALEATILKIAPDSVELPLYQASIALLKGEEDTVYTKAVEALEIEPFNTKATALKAKKPYDTGDYKTALEIIKKTLAQKPQDITLNQLRIEVLIKEGNLVDAAKAYNKLVEYYPHNINLHLALAEFHIKNNDRSKALDAINKFSDVKDISVYQKVRIVSFLNAYQYSNEAILFIKNSQKQHPDNKILSLNLADQYALVQDFQNAELEYQKIFDSIDNNPQSIAAPTQYNAYTNYSKLKLKQGDIQTAKSSINKALAINPQSIAALRIRANLSIFEKDYHSADSDLANIFKLSPDDIEIKNLLAKNKFNMGKYDKSFSLYKKFIDKHPTEKKLIVNYLHHLNISSNHEQAKVTAANWLGANSDQKEVLSLYAEALVGLKEFNQLLGVVNRYEKIAGETSFSYFAKAIAYSGLNQEKRAIAFYKKSISQEPSNLRVTTGLLDIYKRSGNANFGTVFFKNLLEKNKENPVVLYALGTTYHIQELYDDAKTIYKKLIEASPNTPIGYSALASIHSTEGNRDKAKEILLSGLSTLPTSPSLHKEIGVLQVQDGDFRAAINSFGIALKLNPSDLHAANNYISLVSDHYNDITDLDKLEPLASSIKNFDPAFLKDTIGWFYYRLGDYAEAQHLLEQAVNINPYEPIFLYHLGMVYKAQNQKELAKTTLAKSIEIASTDFIGIHEAKKSLESL